MRLRATLLGAATLFLAGCTSPEITPEQRRAALNRTTGTIVGVVREAGTNQPLDGVFVSAQYLGDQTDADGRFRLHDIKPGEVDVTAWRRDLIQSHGRARVLAAQETAINVTMKRPPPPCCRLAGTWSVRLVLREPGKLPGPRGTEVVGDITFSPNAPDPFPESRRRGSSSDPTLDEFGKYNIDLRPILGEDITRATTNTTFPGRPGSDILKEAEGFVHQRDQVAIDLIPRMSHGGISLTGTINGDEVRGEWIKRDYAPTISGTFAMQRQDTKGREQPMPPSTPLDPSTGAGQRQR
jgi:carboxypeptidase family protein